MSLTGQDLESYRQAVKELQHEADSYKKEMYRYCQALEEAETRMLDVAEILRHTGQVTMADEIINYWASIALKGGE